MRAALIVLIAALLLAAPILSIAAPESSEEARNQARELGGQGIAAYKQGRYDECIEKMKQAEALFHAPAHLLYMARSHAALDRLVPAHRLFVDIAVEEIPSYAAEAFHKAQKEAKAKLYELRTKVTGIEITVAGVPRAVAAVTVDGAAVPDAELDHLVALEPGQHVVAARAEGAESVTRTIQIEAGGRPVPVELTLEPKVPPPTSAASPTAAPPPPPPAPTEPPGPPLLVPGAIAVALGGAALVAGGITGAMTLSEASTIKESCNGTDCPPELESDADAAKTIGNASTGLLIAGGVVAAAGIVMLLIPPSDPGPGADQAVPLRLRLGPAGASLHGWF